MNSSHSDILIQMLYEFCWLWSCDAFPIELGSATSARLMLLFELLIGRPAFTKSLRSSLIMYANTLLTAIINFCFTCITIHQCCFCLVRFCKRELSRIFIHIYIFYFYFFFFGLNFKCLKSSLRLSNNFFLSCITLFQINISHIMQEVRGCSWKLILSKIK